MKLKVFLSVILALLLLCGCSTAPADTTAEATQGQTSVTELQTEKETETEVQTETDAETEGETISVTETEPETETETETVTETETETVTETEKAPETTTVPETTTAPETTKETTTAETTKAPETTRETTTAEVTTAPETTKEETTAEVTTAPETETETDAPTTEPVDDKTPTVKLSVPSNPNKSSTTFAKELLGLCDDGGQSAVASDLKNAGFDIVMAKNYNKASSDRSHTCAYTVGKGKYNDKYMYAIVIRGTSGGEWYSNFDFAPSHSNDTQYAENFYLAAQDIYRNVKSIFDDDKDAYIVVCGHSRGAAVSNLLGVLLNSVYNSERIYVYTFATPATVRGDAANVEHKNIFNYINPNDAVTHVPLADHGYKRAGTDIILPKLSKTNELVTALEDLSSIAPDIKSYYEDKHSLTSAGLSDDGMTVFQVMNYLCDILVTQTADMSKLSGIQPESDLYPLVSLLSKFSDSTQAMKIASEHLPTMYSVLLMLVK
ncbi:MAG: lipase family protein [Clostridia bacterium]|nr:lipase family protein [Clostridia bacterium]